MNLLDVGPVPVSLICFCAPVQVLAGGGAQAVKRSRERNKFLPRERIDRLLDPGASFLELSQVPDFVEIPVEIPIAILLSKFMFYPCGFLYPVPTFRVFFSSV